MKKGCKIEAFFKFINLIKIKDKAVYTKDTNNRIATMIIDRYHGVCVLDKWLLIFSNGRYVWTCPILYHPLRKL